jgi:hypothetical protein
VKMPRYSASESSVGIMSDFLEKWECPNIVCEIVNQNKGSIDSSND